MKKLVLAVVALSMTSALFAQQVPGKGQNFKNNQALNDSLQVRIEGALNDSSHVQSSASGGNPWQAILKVDEKAQSAFIEAYKEYVALVDSSTQEQRDKAFVKMAYTYMNVPDMQRIAIRDFAYFTNTEESEGKSVLALLEEPMAISEELSDAYVKFRNLVFMDEGAFKQFQRLAQTSFGKVKRFEKKDISPAIKMFSIMTLGNIYLVKSDLKTELEAYVNKKLEEPLTSKLHRKLD